MAKLTTDELIEAFKELTLIELSEFVKAFEETFDVTAAAPAAAVVAAAPAAAGEAAAEEEKDEFDVVLEAAGDKKIQVIKEVRTLTSLGLKEAKELVDGAPKPVLEGANKEAAEKAKAQLEGAVVPGTGRGRDVEWGSMRDCGVNRKNQCRTGMVRGMSDVYASALRPLCVLASVALVDSRRRPSGSRQEARPARTAVSAE